MEYAQIVSADEIAEIRAIPFPAHPNTTFDEAALSNLIAHSVSIVKDEKREIIGKVANLNQHQINVLFRIFTEEQATFVVLAARANAARVVTFPPHQNTYAVLAHDVSCHTEGCKDQDCDGSGQVMTATGECPICDELFCVDCGKRDALQTQVGSDHKGLCDSCRDGRAGIAPTAL